MTELTNLQAGDYDVYYKGVDQFGKPWEYLPHPSLVDYESNFLGGEYAMSVPGATMWQKYDCVDNAHMSSFDQGVKAVISDFIANTVNKKVSKINFSVQEPLGNPWPWVNHGVKFLGATGNINEVDRAPLTGMF